MTKRAKKTRMKRPVSKPEEQPMHQSEDAMPPTTGKPRGKESIVSKLGKVMEDLRQEIGMLVQVTSKLDMKASPIEDARNPMAEYVGDSVLLHLLGEFYMGEIQSTEAEKGIRLRTAVIESIKKYKISCECEYDRSEPKTNLYTISDT